MKITLNYKSGKKGVITLKNETVPTPRAIYCSRTRRLFTLARSADSYEYDEVPGLVVRPKS